MRTYATKPVDITRKWYITDAKDWVLGRLATKVAMMLMGKNKPYYTTNLDTGDFVIIVNAEKIQVTGNKKESKIYYKHSGYIGGLKEKTLEEMLEKKPEEVIHQAVKLMLPKTKMGNAMLKKLFIYKGEKHPHKAQKPEKFEN
ncbi:MAG: 50S ribosomal protein L13 [bacterium]|nr:50S ribosomal protein L13 [bacterium]